MEEKFYDFVRNRRLCSLNSVILFIISVVLYLGEIICEFGGVR